MLKKTNATPIVPFSLNCKGDLIFLDTPKIMGVLNITPDSFFDGGRYNAEDQVLAQVEKMMKEGATFIDIGAYSSRPGAAEVSETTCFYRWLEKRLPQAHTPPDSDDKRPI